MATTSDPAGLDIQALELKKAALVFRAINHPLRQKIMQLLHRYERMPVNHIYFKLKMKQSITSQHLAILRGAGLVCTEKEGKHIYYEINYDRLAQLHEVAVKLTR
jgi:DNA-binding transcriptional ArsR family regulator